MRTMAGWAAVGSNSIHPYSGKYTSGQAWASFSYTSNLDFYISIQPIGIRDVLRYLVGALAVPESAGRIIEIGGADILTYGDMMKGYARVRGLRRLLIPVPVLTPRLSAHWVHWMTPVNAGSVPGRPCQVS